MGVKMKTPLDEIKSYIASETERSLDAVVEMLNYVGDEVVKGIRTGAYSNWTDQTGNLRSSIGYIVTVDGVKVAGNEFVQVNGPKEGPRNGATIGTSFAKSIAAIHPKGIALVVVAGMEYAEHVEKLENKTVLAQGEIEARRLIKVLIEKLNRKLGK